MPTMPLESMIWHSARNVAETMMRITVIICRVLARSNSLEKVYAGFCMTFTGARRNAMHPITAIGITTTTTARSAILAKLTKLAESKTVELSISISFLYRGLLRFIQAVHGFDYTILAPTVFKVAKIASNARP